MKKKPVAPEMPTSNEITKREYFAAMALQGNLARLNPGLLQKKDADLIATEAVMLADSLIAELNRGKGNTHG